MKLDKTKITVVWRAVWFDHKLKVKQFDSITEAAKEFHVHVMDEKNCRIIHPKD